MNKIVFAVAILCLTFMSCKTDAGKSDSPSANTNKEQKASNTAPKSNGNKYNVDFSKVKGNKPQNTKVNGGDQTRKNVTGANQAGKRPVVKNTARPVVKDPAKKAIMDKIPNACELVSADFVAKVVGVSVDNLSQHNATTEQSPYTSSCFYRWENNGLNDGILVQVQANPVAEEYAEWVTLFIESKKSEGESGMTGGERYVYKDFDGVGDAGAYSHKLGKYVWRTGNDYAFTLTFRSNSLESKQVAMARKIGQEVMRNYAK